MPPISSQRRAVTEEISSLSDDDVGFLYQVIAAAETKPEADRLPFRALFEAYDEVIGEHGVNADPGHACLRFLFKMGSKGVRGETLFDKFENALQQMGIVIEIGEDGSTNLNETHEYDQYTADITHSQTVDHPHGHSPITNGVPPTPKRRASFNTTYDIGEDATQRSAINRPSSRSSMSRLELGKPEFSKLKLSPTSGHDSGPTKSPDRTQLISQFLDVGRRLLSRFDETENKHGVTEEPPLTNGVVARSAVARDRSKRIAEASRPRRSPSHDSSDTSESEDVQSIMSQSPEHDSFDKEEVPPEFIYRPQLSDLLRDASTFNMYRQRSICRRILTQWLKKAFQARQTRQTRETLAVNYDRGLLLRQAFEPWRGVIQEKRHSARTDRFFKHLEARASRARDLYLMTKAFSHWAQLTSEEVARTSAARRHVLGVKYFNAWREITAVNELKAQRFALQRPFNAWRKKIQDLKAAETQAVSVRNTKIQKAAFWDWWWCFCDRRVLEVSDYRLKRRSLLSWLRNLRTNRERDHEIDLHNKRSSLKSVFQIWSQHSKTIALADQEVQASRRQHDLRETFNEWRIQSRLAPAASRVSEMVDTRILRNALSRWIGKIDLIRQAEEVDRHRIQHNAWISWNDTLRCLALRARIDERIKMEAMYKWILMERFELMRRIREQRIKREVFSRFVTNTRDTYTRLLFHAEAHEAHQTENLVRSKFAIWRDQVQLQREREYVASEFYAPRLAAESLTIWRSKHNQVVKMEGWAQDARFYFLMKKFMKQWHQAKVDSGKRRRQESYAKVRRHIKVNLASKALAAWSSKTRIIMDMEQQAVDVDREKVLADASEIFVQWHDKTTKRIQDCQDADDSYFRQLAFDQMMQMSETFIIRREMEDQADNVYRLHVLRLAAASLRKLSLRIFQMGSTAETAEAMRERNLRKHSRNMFRDWVDKARMKLEARDSAGPTFTPARISTFGNGNGAGSAMFDPWYQEQAETPFKISDFTATSQATSQATSHDPISASPLATPNFTTSPSKRAARARALAQISTTPATPLRTPFPSRLLRAGTTTALSTSSKQPRSGRRSSVGNSVRFVDEEPPESPTDAQRASNSRTNRLYASGTAGETPAKLQSFSTALWDGLRVVAYISGHALVILGGPQTLLQTIYIDDTDTLEAVAFDETSGKIAVCGGPDVFVYQPYGIQGETLKWSLLYTFRAPDDDEPIYTLSWGSSNELLVGNSRLALWFMNDEPRLVWKRKLATPVKFAQFSPDSSLIVTVGHYDRLVKVWRRLAFGADEVRFENSYLPHPNVVTGIHWRLPRHPEQSMDNVLYTFCADNKIRVWAVTDLHALSALQFWAEIDMGESVQPRHASDEDEGPQRRYGFILDGRDFCVATERAVQRTTGNKENHALEHIIEVASKAPEICVVIDGQGHMSAWALEDIGSKAKTKLSVFNILHVEGLDFGFAIDQSPQEDYAQIRAFQSTTSDDKLSVLVHHFDGRIEWYDSHVDVLFDPAPRKKRITQTASWSGHTAPVKKIVRNAIGDTLVSRTNENKATVWTQRRRDGGLILAHKSVLLSDEHIHRTCVLEDRTLLVNLHHDGVSLWDFSSNHAKKLASLPFTLPGKPLCVLPIPSTQSSPGVSYVATIWADMHGIAWEIRGPSQEGHKGDFVNGHGYQFREFCTFDMGLKEDIAYILPVDPAGPKTKMSGFFDSFSTDIALSYGYSGVVRTWTATVDPTNVKVDWLLQSTVDTGITNPSMASGSSIRKAALVDEDRTHLTIWDTNNAQLEFEEHFAPHDIIRDLDWTSTPDKQSILAVGFPHKVVLLSQLRYDYLDSRPSWTQVREIWIRDLTPHPIGDSCWLNNGHLVIGAGNQLFVYDKDIDVGDRLVSELRMPSRGLSSVDLFDIVSRLNGPLPVFHPQYLAQCILSGKTSLVHSILLNLHRKLKFYTEGDELDCFLEMPVECFYEEDGSQQAISKEIRSSYVSYVDSTDEELLSVVDENTAAALNESLARIALPQLSSHEQFRLADTIECVAMVEKHRRSMDDNAARYLLFFRQHMLRRTQGVANKDTVSWREIVWAYHSSSQDILTDLVSRQFNGKLTWKAARESGLFMWLSDSIAVKAQLEILARCEYTKTEEKNPIDCTLYYLALGKKNVLQGLWRIAHWNREQAATQRLLANDFKEPRWRTSALKNAYALLGKRRFEYAASFFLLADHLRDAANVIINQMGDLQLAIAITRASEGDNGPVLREILEEKVLPEAASEGNRWMASWAFWMLGRRDMAVRALISPVETLLSPTTTPATPGSPGRVTLQSKSYLSNDPALVVLYQQLREKTLQTLKGASKVRPREEWEFVIRNARLYDRMGCDFLALDLVRHWEFLGGLPTQDALKPNTSLEMDENGVDYRKMLRRRSSLVVADIPVHRADVLQEPAVSDTTPGEQPMKDEPKPKPKPPPTMFHEPDANSLLDSFGF